MTAMRGFRNISYRRLVRRALLPGLEPHQWQVGGSVLLGMCKLGRQRLVVFRFGPNRSAQLPRISALVVDRAFDVDGGYCWLPVALGDAKGQQRPAHLAPLASASPFRHVQQRKPYLSLEIGRHA